TNQWKGEAAGEGMLATARQWPADLLVLGAFGKALWQEEWFGGTSRHVLACADLPILIAH
ncbi:MAG TPA: universal stress protein, partial [Pinirhizobacter sp.]|uniref:universal stress protein n=1 Tax=Pinirhizobacter sp. TaxID=2950432 RepID=UPI002BE517E6